MVSLPRIIHPCSFATNPTGDSGSPNHRSSCPIRTRILTRGTLSICPFYFMKLVNQILVRLASITASGQLSTVEAGFGKTAHFLSVA